jgi:hypothetical protein
MSFENVSYPARQVVCLIEAKWAFAEDHCFHILLRTTREPKMLVRSNSDAE